MRKFLLKLKGRGLFGTAVDIYLSIRQNLYAIFLRTPGIRTQVQKQVQEAVSKIENKLVIQGPGISRYLTLPKEGWTSDQVRSELESLGELRHTRWEDGLVSGAVYHGGHDLIKLQSEAFEKFIVANPIHPDVFPGVRKMEAEVVAMVLAMFNAPTGAAGVTTGGGTESILMACLSARQKAYKERGVKEPEMSSIPRGVVPEENAKSLQDYTSVCPCRIPESRFLLRHQGSYNRLPRPLIQGPYPEHLPPTQ